LTIARLEFGEQSHVLDSNDGLVGEGLQERNLLIGERAGVGTSHTDHSKRDTVTQHRYAESASEAHYPAGLIPRLPLRIEVDIGHMHYSALEDRASRRGGPGWLGWKDATCGLRRCGSPVVGRDEVHQFPIEAEERAE